MKLILTCKFIILTSLCLAQGELRLTGISKRDSSNLIQTIQMFITAVESHDKKSILSLSLSKVDCEMCIIDRGFENPIEDAFVRADSFATYLFDSLRYSQIWKNIKLQIPDMTSTSSSSDLYHPKTVNLKKGEFFTEFELSYTIDDSPDKYHFSFIKSSSKFKLWGVRVYPN